jgi:hypothetical protein
VETFAIAFLGFAEIVSEGIDSQEANEGVQLAHSVLEWSAGQTPLVQRHEIEHRLGRGGAPVLDHVSFIADDTEPRDGVQERRGHLPLVGFVGRDDLLLDLFVKPFVLLRGHARLLAVATFVEIRRIVHRLSLL